MIVDIHTHLLRYEDIAPPLRASMENCGMDPRMWDFTQEQYLADTRQADRVVVFGLRAAQTGWLASNDYVADFVQRHPDRFVYFASIDPSEPDAMEQLEYAVQKRSCKGVKVGPIYQGIHPLDARYDPIYAYCQAHGLPLMTHMATTFTAGVPLDYARPAHMDDVACRYPGLRIILAHIGHPWTAETLSIIRRQKNCYADISALYYRPWQFYESLVLAAEYGCAHKLFLGSDYPATTTAGTIEGLRGVNRIVEGTALPRVPQTVIDGILHAEPLRTLGID